MNCTEFNDVAFDIARAQFFDARSRAAALDHAGSCDQCSVRLEDERNLSKQLQALADAMNPLSAAPQISLRVIAALRSQSRISSLPITTRRWKTWVAAAAAIVLLVIGLAVQRRNALLTPNRSLVDLSQTTEFQGPQPETGTGYSSGLLKPARNSIRHKSKAIPDHTRASRSSNSAGTRSALPGRRNARNEIATDFFAVGDTSASSLADGGQLIRLELPRSALMKFGLPVNMDRANEKVKADVLVGSDGIARAIRFVE